jgi:hypothetical protein
MIMDLLRGKKKDKPTEHNKSKQLPRPAMASEIERPMLTENKNGKDRVVNP